MKLLDMLLGQAIFGGNGGAAGGGSDLPDGTYVFAGWHERYKLDDVSLIRCGDYLELPNIGEYCSQLVEDSSPSGFFNIVYHANGDQRYTSKVAGHPDGEVNELFLEYTEDGQLVIGDTEGNLLVINTPIAIGDVPPGLYTVNGGIADGFPVMLLYQYEGGE